MWVVMRMVVTVMVVEERLVFLGFLGAVPGRPPEPSLLPTNLSALF